MKTTLKIALQSKGRLFEDSMQLLKDCGIKVSKNSGKLVALSSNFPIEVLFLRDDDIPDYVADGVADTGIVGLNVVEEKQISVTTVEKLGFSKCRLSLAIPKANDYTNVSYFNGKRIATSYPVILQRFLKENNVKADIHEISGSVEIAPGIGLADSIFDIVSSGSTLVSNNLKEVEVVLKSEALLIANENLSIEKQQILQNLLFRIRAVMNARGNKYILLNVPTDNINAICAILPGMKSPTIMPLAKEGWCSLHSVINENDFWSVIGQLKELGAEGILVVPIEKMIL